MVWNSYFYRGGVCGPDTVADNTNTSCKNDLGLTKKGFKTRLLRWLENMKTKKAKVHTSYNSFPVQCCVIKLTAAAILKVAKGSSNLKC